MTPTIMIAVLVVYFIVLIFISKLTSNDDGNDSFFTGKRQSPWYVVAFGMIGASLSGVTFVSVPGWVATSQFSYFQMVLGYLVGYTVIATVLLPLYYRLNLTSIYGYLEDRFGFWSYKSGAFYFLLSRIVGASFRLFLVANILQILVFDSWGIPFALTVVLTISFIWVYTHKAGLKTIIWTDTLQTLFMILAVVLCFYHISNALNFTMSDAINQISLSEYSKIFFLEDSNSSLFFPKQFLAGAFIAIVMTGLDQDMMQKNLSCRSLKDAQKNMFWFSIVLVLVNLLFLGLGALLYIHADHFNIQATGDDLFAAVAMHESMPVVVGLFFLLGLIAAAYSSADSALTSLTTSFCIDILGVENKPITQQIRIRKQSHLFFSAVLFIVILMFKWINDESVVAALFKVAGYTYGPLLGMYAFGLFTPWRIRDKWILPVVLSSPIISYYLQLKAPVWWGFEFGFELLVVNGLLCFLGMVFIRQK
jgi:SSS family solute:Na+ symporter